MNPLSRFSPIFLLALAFVFTTSDSHAQREQHFRQAGDKPAARRAPQAQNQAAETESERLNQKFLDFLHKDDPGYKPEQIAPIAPAPQQNCLPPNCRNTGNYAEQCVRAILENHCGLGEERARLCLYVQSPLALTAISIAMRQDCYTSDATLGNLSQVKSPIQLQCIKGIVNNGCGLGSERTAICLDTRSVAAACAIEEAMKSDCYTSDATMRTLSTIR